MKNRLYVVGIGPGSLNGMTIEAKQILDDVDLIVGYITYVNLIKPFFPDKVFEATGMGKEVDRVILSLDAAKSGKNVALICSGDSSLYGMAALCHELKADRYDTYKEVDITTIPGVTSALSGGALLGAAIGNDFCTISLSDYHTDFEDIIKRVRYACMGDFVVALYNPVSKRRPDGIKRVCDALSDIVPEDRICGIARNIGRADESVSIVKLSELRNANIDMFTTVFIGNAASRDIDGKMVTVRGYEI